MRIVFVTRSIAGGGAERQLLVLARGLARRGHHCSVVTFYAPPSDACPREIEIISLDKKGRWDLFRFSFRLLRAVRGERPDIVHGYLPVPNIAAAVVGLLLPGAAIVFGVRSSRMDLCRYDRASRWVHRLETALARRARAVIVNSRAGRQDAIDRGIPEDRLFLVRNGIDADAFSFDAEARRQLRSRWTFEAGEIVVGVIARLDPMKDHATFLRAFSQAARHVPKLRAIFFGEGPAGPRRELEHLADELGISEAIRWAGAETNIAGVYSGVDILCLSSAFGEGTPNVVAEAMACERPCIVTDVGDARELVGQFGVVVPPAVPEALAAAIISVAAMPEDQRLSMGRGARRRIKDAYSVSQLVSLTASILRSLTRHRDGPPPPG